MHTIEPDLILYNGDVITGPERLNGDGYTAVAVKYGRIAALGTDAEILGMGCRRKIDLGGKPLMPGFISNHDHFVHDAMFKMCVDCTGDQVRSIPEILAVLQAQISLTPEGEWVTGFGYHDFDLLEQRDPTREELDSIASEHPLMIIQKSAHAGMVNTRGLETLGIPLCGQVEGENSDEIIRDADGTATGRLNETTLFTIGKQLLKELYYAQDEAAQMRALGKTGDEFLSRGVTTAVDAWCNPEELELYRKGIDAGILKPRVVMMPLYETCSNLLHSGMITNYSYGRIKIGPIKLFSDGSLTSRTAAVSVPFGGTDCSIAPVYSQQQMDDMVAEIDGLGFQIATHAVGDVAIEQVLNAYEKVIGEGGNPRRHRIEHLSLLTEILLERCAALNIVGIVIPQGIYAHGDRIIDFYGDYIDRFQIYRSLLQKGVRLAGHSDMPLLPVDPIAAMQTAVERKTRDGIDFCPQECIGIVDAIRLYTTDAAFAVFEEQRVGSIDLGKCADFTVLSQSLLTTPVAEWRECCRVEMTIVDGEVVYQAERP
jgi:predicted amidohydrolase YtcJ